MKTIPAREIKRRGISAVDKALKNGPVHVIKNDRPSYVVMDEAQYQGLLEEHSKAYLARVKASLRDLKAGRVRRVTARKLIDELGLES
jgi:PHD/YefM family antitoxin component YafN of YafNO toxin-antitoxin module